MGYFTSLSPLSVTSVLLTLGVIFVNGLTDAPNAIATCVTTRCLSVRSAVVLSAVFNLAGVTASVLSGASVTKTVMGIINVGASITDISLCLAASMFAVVLWALLAWYFGIPTSESHALIAGLTGSAFCFGSFGGLNFSQWMKTLYGLALSCVGGFGAGFVICRVILTVFKNIKRCRAEKFFRYAQIVSAAAMSFMHGAQDGQKFIAVLMMCAGANEESVADMTAAVFGCAVTMGLGTLCGGKRIIKAVGMDMVRLSRYQGFGADTAGALSIFLSTVFGLPVSTTHAKTTAMVGCALAGGNGVNKSVITDMLIAWLLTFPGCGLLSFFIAKLFSLIF